MDWNRTPEIVCLLVETSVILYRPSKERKTKSLAEHKTPQITSSMTPPKGTRWNMGDRKQDGTGWHRWSYAKQLRTGPVDRGREFISSFAILSSIMPINTGSHKHKERNEEPRINRRPRNRVQLRDKVTLHRKRREYRLEET